jgi:alkanesulfonate monooxygenase SsuD/methylene tetrahydromethanopterin reductase-like flavin-dependent oxidoreductase (luciferase family)
LQYGVFIFGAVPMPDAGAGDPQPNQRRTTNELVWETTERIIDSGVLADQLGFDYFFFTEHHFQHEGYEVVPNAILAGTVLAERTERIKIGALCHVVPQWHPLRFAEDFASLHNFSGGRGVLAVGRGTVPREAIPLGAIVGSTDDPVHRAEQDGINREMFAEAMDVIDLALNNERFTYHGEHYSFPPAGIPDRGSFTEDLTLVPRPLTPYETWQTVTSPPTLEAVARRGVGGVWWNLHPDLMEQQWAQFADHWADEHGEPLASGEQRMVVINVRVADTHDEAVAAARAPFDEHWKFLAPYGRSKGFRGPDGGVPPDGWIPTLENAIDQCIALVGTADEVAGQLSDRISQLSATNVAFFPLCLGDTYDRYNDQLRRLAEDVLPNVRT